MFVSVRKMVSMFEGKKQPRPVSLPPSLNTPLNSAPPTPPAHHPSPPLADSEPHPPSSSRPLLRPEEQHVTRRGNATLQRFLHSRVRDSWPAAKVDYHPRAFHLAVSTETKEPISSKHRPHACLGNKRRDVPSSSTRTSIPQSIRDRTSQCPSETTPPSHPQTPAGSAHSITTEKQSVVDTASSQTHPSALRTAPSGRSGPFCVTDQRFQRGGACKQRLRPSDSTLLSLLLFFHR